MLTQKEPFEITPELIEHLAPQLGQRNRHPHTQAPSTQTPYTPPFAQQDEPSADILSSPLSHLIERLAPLPPFTTIVGICDDGLPLLLDLSDPTPGAILIHGHDERGEGRLLQLILASASALNPVQRFNFLLITPDPEPYLHLSALPHCRGIFSSYGRRAAEAVIELTQLADERRSGRNLGAAWVLAIEHLNTLVQYQGYEVLSHLRWLVQFGPQSGIRPVASLTHQSASAMDMNPPAGGDERLLEQFHTHIYQTQPRPWPRAWGGGLLPAQHTPTYSSSAPFTIRLGNEWVRFWLPAMD